MAADNSINNSSSSLASFLRKQKEIQTKEVDRIINKYTNKKNTNTIKNTIKFINHNNKQLQIVLERIAIPENLQIPPPRKKTTNKKPTSKKTANIKRFRKCSYNRFCDIKKESLFEYFVRRRYEDKKKT